MDYTKAQRLLLKIQAFLTNESGQEISRLEKDLLKSYILQLYEAVMEEGVPSPPQLKSNKAETPVFDAPPVRKSEPVYEESPPPVPEIKVTRPADIPVEVTKTEKETIIVPPKAESKPVQIPIEEPVKETIRPLVHTPAPRSDSNGDALAKLFEPAKVEEMATRFSHVPIPNIESAMGLNERIFTLNELFGGDKALFDATCQQLNSFSSFAEARQLLLHGVASRFHWGDPERLKMAEEFIRIVARRYPKS